MEKSQTTSDTPHTKDTIVHLIEQSKSISDTLPTARTPATILSSSHMPAVTPWKANHRLPRLIQSQDTTYTFTILYIFAGARRSKDIGHWLTKLAKDAKCKVIIKEMDIVRRPTDDVSYPEIQWKIRQAVMSGEYDAVIVTPPCNTFSRLRWANRFGPRPIRSRHHPRGFPWLSNIHKKQAKLGNNLVDFSIAMAQDVAEINAKATHQVLILGEHPEDLGITKHGDPGSMFCWPEFTELVNKAQFVTVALHQSCFGAPTPKPTRLWGNFWPLLRLGVQGLPTFDAKGRYIGPLSRSPASQKTATLVRQPGDQGFRSGPSAAYPSTLCHAIAFSILESCINITNGHPQTTNWGLPLAYPTGWGAQIHKPPRGSPAKRRLQLLTELPPPKHQKPPDQQHGEDSKPMNFLHQPPSDDDDDDTIPALCLDEEAFQDPLDNTQESSDDDEGPWNDPTQKFGQGWWGTGKPMQVRQGRKTRDMQDGGGYCSPGRWLPCDRREQSEEAQKLSQLIRDSLSHISRKQIKK